MAPLNRPSKGYRAAVQAIVAKRKPWISAPSPAEHPRLEMAAALEALRDGRPYSSLPPDHAVALLRPPPPPAEPAANPVDLASSPGARLAQQMEDLRKRMLAEGDVPDFDELRRDTIREIEREQRDSARRERQRLKRARKAERRAQEREQALSG
jgi:hypothetical protein